MSGLPRFSASGKLGLETLVAAVVAKEGTLTHLGVSNGGTLQEIVPSFWSALLLDTIVPLECSRFLDRPQRSHHSFWACDVMEDIMFTDLFCFVASDILMK